MEPNQQTQPIARFVTGSTMRHVLTMTATASVGLIAVFAVAQRKIISGITSGAVK